MSHDTRVMEIAAAALAQAAEDRPAFLAAQCADDAALFQEVAELVHREQRMGTFLLTPALSFTAPASYLSPGQRIGDRDRFEILREVGAGGMGIVYEAFDHKRQSRVALKCARPGFQSLLSPELHHALLIRHRNVCRMNEIHSAELSHGSVDFLTMELLEGPTLAARLRERGRLEAKEALVIARQLCEGLGEAHLAGVVHGDFKSANVILTNDATRGVRAVITDFGLARGDRKSGQRGGSPGYLAPEIWRGEECSTASDIYALGAVLHEMVTGHTPKRPADGEAGGLPADRHPVGMPSRWKPILSSCLRADPRLRPASCAAVLSGLERSTAPLVGAFAATAAGAAGVLAVLFSGAQTPPVRSARTTPSPPPRPLDTSALIGDWTADVRYPWARTECTEFIRFERAGSGRDIQGLATFFGEAQRMTRVRQTSTGLAFDTPGSFGGVRVGNNYELELKNGLLHFGMQTNQLDGEFLVRKTPGRDVELLPYIRGQSMTFVARRAPQPVDFGARPQACKRSPSDPGRR